MADVKVWLVSRVVPRADVNGNHEAVTQYFAHRIFDNSGTDPKKALRFISQEGAELAAQRLGEGWAAIECVFNGSEKCA